MKPPQGPPQIPPATPEQEPVLSFEEFILRDKYGFPRYNNFHLYFTGWHYYINREHFKRFVSEHKAMAESLTKKVKSLAVENWINPELLKPLDRELYEAYKIMHSYGVADHNLFS